ncbi:lipoprotein [Candidatus Magnetobacterium bavaricum]|uniref:Lipoprotein n=1 Tax=Candidatus Magnetobacterium bavaricum TaxID=29290 RepID=A0A0F3GQC3_9BACT|nr:lipoprotein [Candidatus Magnetobacterium bavaricum]
MRFKMKRRLVIAIQVSFVCLMAAGACVPIPYIGIDGPYTGRVLEFETDEPIEGAAVAAEWVMMYGVGVKCCYKETFTDKNGEFKLPAVMCIAPVYSPGVSYFDDPNLVIFKPGYLGYPPMKTKKDRYSGGRFDKDHRHNVIRLDKAVTLSERSETLKRSTSFSFLGEEPKKVVFERELPHLFKLSKQEKEELTEEYIKEFGPVKRYEVGPIVVPPIITPSINKQPINKGGNNEE